MKKIFFAIVIIAIVAINFVSIYKTDSNGSTELSFYKTAMAGVDENGNPIKDTPKSTCCQCGHVIKVCCPLDYIGPCQKTCGK